MNCRPFVPAILAFATAVMPARAAVSIFGLSVEFSGATSPAGTSPWIVATIDDSFGGANTVRLTVDAANLVGTEFASEISFNLNPAKNPTGLTFALIQNPTTLTLASIGTGVDAFKADGDGDYDIHFDFMPSGGGPKDGLESGETFIVDITYTSALAASDFVFLDVGGTKGDFYAAAHVQSISPGDKSGWVGAPTAIPEPGTYSIVFGLSAFAAIGLARWHKQRDHG